MKAFLKVIVFIFVLPISAFSQDSSGYSMSAISAMPAMLHLQRTFIFIDITNGFWLSKPDDIKTNLISGGVNFNLAYEIQLVKNIFTIAPGISFSNVTVKNNATYQYEFLNDDPEGYTALIPISDSVEYLKNKLSTSFIDIPLELRFRVNPDERGRNFWIAPGFRIGWLVSDFWKYKYSDGVDKMKTKTYNIKNLETFHYGISLRTGFYKFGVYAFYSLSDLFESGTEVTPFTVGITVTPF